MRILLVEDDKATAAVAKDALVGAGHQVKVTFGGEAAVSLVKSASYDAIVLDRRLPDCDGLTVLKEIRRLGVGSPVLFLTAVGSIQDRIEGLRCGGDDYLVKPFALGELVARVNALLRRNRVVSNNALTISDLEMDLITRQVLRGGRQIDLQNREFAILEMLIRNKNQVVTRTMLVREVWKLEFEPKSSVIQTNISRLRSKVDLPGEKVLIHTVRGIGYSIRDAS